MDNGRTRSKISFGAYARMMADMIEPITAKQEKCSASAPDVLDACAALDEPVDAVRVALVLPVPALAPVAVAAAVLPLALVAETTAATDGSPV